MTYYRRPKDEAAEHERVWREAERLRLLRDPSECGDDGWRDRPKPKRAPVHAVVEAPEDPDERDLVEWFADECPVQGTLGKPLGVGYDPRKTTLRWMLYDRKSVDSVCRLARVPA